MLSQLLAVSEKQIHYFVDENGFESATGIAGEDFLQPALQKPDCELPGRLPHVERRDRQ